MGYIIAGANLADPENPNVTHRAETAAEALEKIQVLVRGGYRVRTSTSEAEDVSLAALKARVVLDEAL